MKRLALPVVFLAVAARLVVSGQMKPSPLLGISATDVFFDDTVVQDVRLDMNAAEWQTLKANFREDTYYPADFRWRDQVVRGAGIRSRGLGTRSPLKPGLRVDFNRFVDGQEFLGLKSVVLKNNVTDASNMRERISMLLFRRMGFPASREVTARLFVNNDFAGVYTLVESVDKAFLKRVFSENDGFLFSFEWSFPYYFTDRGTDPSLYVPSPFQPETHEDDPKPEAIVDLVQAINHSPNFAAEMPTYLDLRKFIRQIAVETCLADHDDFLGDFGMANFFLYRPPDKKQFVMLPWDKSEAFTHPQFSIFQNIRGVSGGRVNQLMDRAIAVPELFTLYLDTLLECAAAINEPGTGDPRGWLEREIERENAQIRDFAFADPVKPFANGDYDAEVFRLLDFARRRGAFVAQEVNASR
jgi:spore coat protein CotH